MEQFPEIPTTREQGFDFESSVLYAMFAPSRTPENIQRQLNEKINEALNSPDVRDRLAKAGLPVTLQSHVQLAARLAAEVQQMERLATEAGIVPHARGSD
jgi:tripartite-type tricarboxylate transporter receptor subunit TctC